MAIPSVAAAYASAQVAAKMIQESGEGSSSSHRLTYEQEQAIHRNNDLMELENLEGVPLIKERFCIDTSDDNCLNCSDCMYSIKLPMKKSLNDVANEICGDENSKHILICQKALQYLSIENSKCDEYHKCDLFKYKE